jgi:2-polyprenyl-6-methoxyphenol hydroxylase-like FAD-dependent oxidoreductase
MSRLQAEMQADGRQDSGTEVTVQFEDHTTATADLVVGCDGIHSTIRSQFVADNPQYSGRIAWRGLVPIADVEAWWPCESYSASWYRRRGHAGRLARGLDGDRGSRRPWQLTLPT